jgi:predicted nucleic acid-binding protein
MRIYVDTNVWLDAALDRENELGRPIGKVARVFFDRALKSRHEFVVSDWTLEEFHKHCSDDRIFSGFGHQIMYVSYTSVEVQAAKDRADHWHDALHLIIAEREADVLVTRNVPDFRSLDPKVQVLTPEDASRSL